MSNRVIAQQLLAAGVTDTVQLVNRTSAMAAATGASKHSGSRWKKQVHCDDFNIDAAQLTLLPSRQPLMDPRKCPFCDGSYHLEHCTQIAKAAQLLEAMRGENARTNDVWNQSLTPTSVISSTSNAPQSSRKQSKLQPSKSLTFDGNQSLLNVLQSSIDKSVEIPSIQSKCLPLSLPLLTALMVCLASTLYNRELFFVSVHF